MIDILGGLVIGVVQQGMMFADALQRYTLLTVGDGLVTQIPALLISTATGIIITRAASENSLGTEMSQQLLSEPKTLRIASGVMLLFALIPGLPVIPFVVLSGATGGLAYALDRWKTAQIEIEQQEAEEREIEGDQAAGECLKLSPAGSD